MEKSGSDQTALEGRRRKAFCISLLLAALLLIPAVPILKGTSVEAATKTGFVTKNGNTYYYKANGKKKKGWLKLDGKRYYFSKKNGVMAKGLTRINSYVYYFNKTYGYAFTGGFKHFSKGSYYFSPKNGRGHIGWLSLDGALYYFNKRGKMYKDRSATIDGKTYVFGSDGKATVVEYEVYDSENIKLYDSGNDRYYLIRNEYLQHAGVADGTITDEDLLAAFAECEAGDQGADGMVAVCLCLLNRTIDEAKEFPSTLRGVIYHGGSFAQYSLIETSGWTNRLLLGQYESEESKAAAYAAAKRALKIFRRYVSKGKPRIISSISKTADFNYKYYMMDYAFWAQSLTFSKVVYIQYKDHIFFVDWV